MTIPRNITIPTNATLKLSVRWYDVTNDVPFLLSDAKFQVRQEENSPDVVLEATVDNGMVIIDDLNNGGWATVWVPSSAMSDLSYYGGAVYDFIITRDVDSEQKRAMAGRAVLSRGVTRD